MSERLRRLARDMPPHLGAFVAATVVPGYREHLERTIAEQNAGQRLGAMVGAVHPAWDEMERRTEAYATAYADGHLTPSELGRPISPRHAALISVSDEVARGWWR